MELKNKIVIVTGASKGIGLATARLLTKHGAKVALVARSYDKLCQISKELPDSLPIKTDMTKIDDIKDMVEQVMKHYGRIDILINNAGQGYDAKVEKINIDTYHNIFNLDVVGPIAAMQEVIPVMKKQKSGTIINISSGTALMFLPGMSAYSSMKRALVGITLTAREELKENNITVSVVYPYITLTDFEKNTIKEEQEKKDSDNFQNENNDLPPFDTPEHVAKIILDGIKSGEAEIYAHEWMKNNKA